MFRVVPRFINNFLPKGTRVINKNIQNGMLKNWKNTHFCASNLMNKVNKNTENQMSKEEEEFERQFTDWEKQFDTWKQQNQKHPYKVAFAQYEKQWQEWRQLLQKKEQMQKAKAGQMANIVSTPQSTTSASVAGAVSSQINSTNVTDAAATTSTAAMYYHPPSYMYMQPYMYPGAAGVEPAAVVPPAVIPPTAVMPPAVIPPTMPPTGVPPVTMPPVAMAPTVSPQQMPFNAVPPGPPDNYGNQNLGPSQHGENMNNVEKVIKEKTIPPRPTKHIELSMEDVLDEALKYAALFVCVYIVWVSTTSIIKIRNLEAGTKKTKECNKSG